MAKRWAPARNAGWVSMMRVGNAPVSWAIYEAAMGVDHAYPPEKVLSDIAEAGYEGAELGPYGYLPTEPDALGTLLARFGLALGSSFVPVQLANPEALAAGIEEVLRVGALLRTQSVQEVILADAMDPNRAAIAGRATAQAGFTEAQWKYAARAVDTIAHRLFDAHGMRIVLHHHAGTFVETPDEIDHLLAMTDPERVGLLLDTGHYVYGGGDVLECLRRHGRRVRYVHLKDVREDLLARARREQLDLKSAWSQGVFCQLGAGCVPFGPLLESLRGLDYTGWLIVEQDVIPNQNGLLLPEPLESARQSRLYLREQLGV